MKSLRNVLLVFAILIGGLFSQANADTLTVPAGGNLQSALDAAQPGDRIVVEAGATFVGKFELPPKDGTGTITVESSRITELPEGVRVGPQHTALMAQLRSNTNGEPVIVAAPGAANYRLLGLDISTLSASVVVFDLVRFGEGRFEQTTLAQVPRNIILDRSYVHGWPTQDVQRGVTLNCANCDVTNSYISEIHGVGFDTQAIAGWNGTLNARIINNHLEAAGENIMFGGADAASADLIPAGIEIRQNYVFKPLSWKVGDPSYAGKHWTVKNLLELKNALNVVIVGNVFENNWTDGQSGIPILFTVRNQECTNPFATIQNVTFSHNTVKNAEGVFNFLGEDNEAEPDYEDRPGHAKCSDAGESFGSIRGSGFVGFNNLAYDIRGAFLTINGFDNVSLERMTEVRKWNFAIVYGQASQGFRFTNGITFDHEYGIWTEDGKRAGDPTGLLPGAVVEQNVIVNVYDRSSWSDNNVFLTSLILPADFRSPYPDRGADIDALNAAQSGAIAVPTPTPTPTPEPVPSPTVTPTPLPLPSPTPTPLTVSPDNTRLPPATQIVDATLGVWTLDGITIRRNGFSTGGQGSLVLWYGGNIYAIGIDGNWWLYLGGTNWTRVAGDPSVSEPTPTPEASPTPTPEPSPTPLPSPSPSPSPTPTPAPSPSPTPKPCPPGQRKQGRC